MKRWMALAAGLAAATAAFAQAGDDEAVRAEGTANRPRIKVAPTFVNGPRATLSEAEKAQGHHGTVVIDGVIGVDGRMQAARVKTSSGLPALDAAAMTAAQGSTFTPAKDAAGMAMPVLIAMPFELLSYNTPKGGLFEYKCDQFVRDMDWWRGVHPQRPFGEHELYKLELGVMMLSLIGNAPRDQAKIKAAIDGFDARWNAAIATCRDKPGMLQKDALYR